MVASLEADQAGKATPDSEVLSLATAAGRAVLTLNRRHFVRLHLDGHRPAGIIACTLDPDFIGQAQRIHAAIESAGDLEQKLLRVNRPQTS